MSLQYITDDKGQTAGVYMTIEAWDHLKRQFKGLEEEATSVPEWQKEAVRERINSTQTDDYVAWEAIRNALK